MIREIFGVRHKGQMNAYTQAAAVVLDPTKQLGRAVNTLPTAVIGAAVSIDDKYLRTFAIIRP